MATATASLPQAAYQLGEPFGTYYAKGKVTTGTTVVGAFAGFGLLITGMIAVAGLSSKDTPLAAIGGVLTLLCVGVVGYAWREYLRAPYPTLLLTEQGVVYIAGETVTTLKWNEIDGVIAHATDNYLMGKYQGTTHHTSVRNMTSGIYIGAGPEFTDTVQIKDIFTQKILPMVQPRILERFERGETIPFTFSADNPPLLSISKQGITHKSKTYPWSQVHAIRLDKRENRVNESSTLDPIVVLQHSGGTIHVADLMMVVNYPILELLVKQNQGR
jgi:hypothetical protein